MRLLIMGPPGSGKGTQAAIVAKRFGMPAISTGDIFRANVAEGTPLGREAERYMSAGQYVPDELTNRMIRERLNEADTTDGFLLDGYPRTVAQVEFLDSVLAEQGVAQRIRGGAVAIGPPPFAEVLPSCTSIVASDAELRGSWRERRATRGPCGRGRARSGGRRCR